VPPTFATQLREKRKCATCARNDVDDPKSNLSPGPLPWHNLTYGRPPLEFYVGARDLFEIVDGAVLGERRSPTDSRVTPCYLSALMKRFGMQITTPIILICVVIATSAPSLALDTAVPSCDVFKQRLGDAPRVLKLQLPKLRLNPAPPDLGDDTWAWPGIRATDGKREFDTTVHCREGKFKDIFSNIDAPDRRLHPTFDLIAAGIYAYTGWNSDQVTGATYELLKKQPRDTSEMETTKLPGAYAKITNMQFAIELRD
jgi:hypothetical protein